jgi:CheY-like chemotaxis protein
MVLEYDVKEDILYRYYGMPRSKERSFKKLGIHEFKVKNKGRIFIHPDDLEKFEKIICRGKCNSIPVRIRKNQIYQWYDAFFKEIFRKGELKKVCCILKKSENGKELSTEYALLKKICRNVIRYHFEFLNLIDIKTGKYYLFRVDEKECSPFYQEGDYDYWIHDILNHGSLDESSCQIIKHLQKKELVELLKKEPMVKRYFRIHTMDGEQWKSIESRFYKEDKRQILQLISDAAEDRKIQKTIDNIRSSLNQMVSDILDFAQITPQHFRIYTTNYQMSSVLSELYNIVRTQLNERSVKLFLDIERSVPEYLIGDRVKICQMIHKFLMYSLAFTSKGSITIKVEGDSTDDDHYSLHMVIKDTGIDMEDRIAFSPDFSDCKGLEDTPSKSFGVEILMSKKMAQLMGGDVTMESNHDGGLQVHIILNQKVMDEKLVLQKIEKPVHILVLEKDSLVMQHILWLMDQLKIKCTVCKTYDSIKYEEDYTHVLIRSTVLLANTREWEMRFKREYIIVLMDQIDKNHHVLKRYHQVIMPFLCIQLPTLLNEQPAENAKQMICRGKILVIEDHQGSMEKIRKHLDKYPLEIDFADSKRETLEFLQKKIYDLVLMDEDMEGLSGEETLALIRDFGDLYQDIPVIALTSKDEIGFWEELLDLGFQDYVVKPVENAEVSRILHAYIGKKAFQHRDNLIDKRQVQDYPSEILLGKLGAACRDMEYDFAAEIIFDMLGFTYPQKIKEHLYAMLEQLEVFDYDEFDRLSEELLAGCV